VEFEATQAAAGAPVPRSSTLADEFSRGTTIGRYVVLGKIGAGAIGVVYAAHDPELDRKVALKFLQLGSGSDGAGRAKLLREAQALAKLSHPNVVAIYDVGTHGDRVWIAMEFVAGQTLGEWASTQRPWRQTLPVLMDVVRGLSAAHEAGLVHRDLKPDNIMVGTDGRVRVMDFGLAHGRVAVDKLGTMATAISDTKVPPELAALALHLTQVGSIQGTPAYMAPEQWEGKEATATADQFAWGVTVWELLYGERPFTGETVVSLAAMVLLGKRRAPVTARRVPGWLRRVVERALTPDPTHRWPTMRAIQTALERGLLRARVIRMVAIGAGISIAASAILVGYPRWEEARRIDALVAASTEEIAEIQQRLREADALRNNAFQAFVSGHTVEGEKLWARYLAGLPGIEGALVHTGHQLEIILNDANKRDDVRGLLLDILLQRALWTECTSQDAVKIQEQVTRLKLYDRRGNHVAQWEAPAQLHVTTEPPGASVTLDYYAAEDGLSIISRTDDLGKTPLSQLSLGRGSYRLRFALDGHTTVLYPVLLGRGEDTQVRIELPPSASVPDGFIYIPEGRLLYGTDGQEEIRVSFNAEPMHAVDTGPFLIARNEVTYQEYLAYLEALPADKRSTLLAASKAESSDVPHLTELPQGVWQLELNTGIRLYTAKSGERLTYEGRNQRTTVVWERLPITGITLIEFKEYLAWLDQSGRVPGARFCSEHEWERAARGADSRSFSTGARLDSTWANISTTYGKVSSAFGPDPVGSYPQSESPFGLHDTAGNIYELTLSPHTPDLFVARGGAFYFDVYASNIANRFEIPANFRHNTVGLRVCATWPPPSR
jgi:formylglycine-generating enzyme required for sulfatase activity/predicted Ser/Thr protein kinase